MILEHEIPEGSKLYFGSSAKKKRHIENIAANLFCQNEFEEIVSPIFMHEEHQNKERLKQLDRLKIIRFSSEKNHQMVMRHDSTIDIVRIITKRLGKATIQKKWFYIQPIFSYPTNECNQIGAECFDVLEINNMINLAVEFFNQIDLKPILQITNVNILKLCAKENSFNLESFFKMDIQKIQNISYINDLLKIQTKEDLQNSINKMPNFLKYELEVLLNINIRNYKNVIYSPLFFATAEYYEDLFFRMFIDNNVFLNGGRYTINDLKSCGFGIYTDDIIHFLSKKEVD